MVGSGGCVHCQCWPSWLLLLFPLPCAEPRLAHAPGNVRLGCELHLPTSRRQGRELAFVANCVLAAVPHDLDPTASAARPPSQPGFVPASLLAVPQAARVPQRMHGGGLDPGTVYVPVLQPPPLGSAAPEQAHVPEGPAALVAAQLVPTPTLLDTPPPAGHLDRQGTGQGQPSQLVRSQHQERTSPPSAQLAPDHSPPPSQALQPEQLPTSSPQVAYFRRVELIGSDCHEGALHGGAAARPDVLHPMWPGADLRCACSLLCWPAGLHVAVPASALLGGTRQDRVVYWPTAAVAVPAAAVVTCISSLVPATVLNHVL